MDRADLNMGFNQFSEPHQAALKRMLEKTQASNTFQALEIGCWLGESTNVICNFLKDIRRLAGFIDCSLHVIDTFQGSEETALVELAKRMNVKEIFLNNMSLLGNNSITHVYQGKSQEMSNLFENESFDFIFIDGDHRYDGVKADIELYYPKLKPGGIICGHDYDHPEYDEAFIHQDFVNNKHHGVIKAVNQYFGGHAQQDFVFWWTTKPWDWKHRVFAGMDPAKI